MQGWALIKFLVLILVFLGGFGRYGSGAQITVDKITEVLSQINIEGNLRSGDDAAFLAATLGVERALVVLDSDGGNLLAGLEIGRIIRARGFSTTVRDGRRCASACALAWLGGRRRFMGATSAIGFHAAYEFERGFPATSGVGNALIGAYLASLGLPDRAVIYITMASPSEMTWLNVSQARAQGIEVDVLSTLAEQKPEREPSGPPTRAAWARPMA